MNMAMQNRYAGKCNNPTCRKHVGENQGYITKVNGRWVTWCSECVPERIGGTAAPRRVLTADGKIITPYEPANVPLIKALPGARWDKDNRWWSVSLDMADRRRILEVADRLGLDVAPSLREIAVTEEAQNALHAGLYPFQVEGVNWMAHKDKAILGDEMGLGKTVMSLMTVPTNGKALVVCRAGLKYNWLDETQKWRPDLKPVVLNHRGSFRWPNRGEVIIVNYDLLPDEFNTPKKSKGEQMQAYWDRLKVYRRGLKESHAEAQGTVLIVDEAHDYKNRQAARSRKMKEIVRLTGNVKALTGSPLVNRPDDLFGVLDVMGLADEVFGSYVPPGGFGPVANGNRLTAYDRFKHLFNAYDDTIRARGRYITKTVWGKPNPVVPELLRRVMIRRRRAEVLPDLPSKTYTTLLVGDVDPALKAQLDALWEEWGTFIQIEEELPPFERFSKVRDALARSRIPAMLEYVENAEEQDVPLVVFSDHLGPLDALLTRPGWAVITGVTSPEKRQEIVRAFQAGHLKGVGVSIRAGGVGLTLTRAWKALFVDMTWQPGANWQAEDRVARIGQKFNKVEIVRMVSDHPLDLHIVNLLADKIDTIHKAVDNLLVGEKVERPAQGETDEQFEARMARVLAQQQEAERKAKEQAATQAKEKAKAKVQGIHETPSRYAGAITVSRE
jgi:SWI/SNF-related matrix-associated actin-dependent regulator 1 of chromatin subfamily A